MKRIALVITVLAFITTLVSCSGSRKGYRYGGPCKDNRDFIGYGGTK